MKNPKEAGYIVALVGVLLLTYAVLVAPVSMLP